MNFKADSCYSITRFAFLDPVGHLREGHGDVAGAEGGDDAVSGHHRCLGVVGHGPVGHGDGQLPESPGGGYPADVAGQGRIGYQLHPSLVEPEPGQGDGHGQIGVLGEQPGRVGRRPRVEHRQLGQRFEVVVRLGRGAQPGPGRLRRDI